MGALKLPRITTDCRLWAGIYPNSWRKWPWREMSPLCAEKIDPVCNVVYLATSTLSRSSNLVIFMRVKRDPGRVLFGIRSPARGRLTRFGPLL
jgi:hypothetical protein